jgi:hypothetical protein
MDRATMINHRHLAIIAFAILLAHATLACAYTESNTYAADGRTQLIQRLRAAEELDRSRALDVSLGPVASGDYGLRADRAHDVADKLEHGVAVSSEEISEALFVPPASLAETQRAELVRRLEHARQRDEQGWWDWTRDPVIAQNFQVQARKAKRVIRDLETNQPVSWADIDEAMRVPTGY